MAAYIVARVNVRDWKAYREYMLHTPRVISQFGGRFIVRGSESVTLEGPEETLRIVLIEFPSLERAKAFYSSREYSRIKKFREGAGEVNLVLVDGYPAETWETAVRESSKLTAPD
ncbi:MAG TPA: DUF1330 domain-containing protein [Candidatus Polarisedimenticolia bacterium]|nr:DUF1330 domain-containing protein [Candidatus Polarisedimenticolia bacterium]